MTTTANSRCRKRSRPTGICPCLHSPQNARVVFATYSRGVHCGRNSAYWAVVHPAIIRISSVPILEDIGAGRCSLDEGITRAALYAGDFDSTLAGRFSPQSDRYHAACALASARLGGSPYANHNPFVGEVSPRLVHALYPDEHWALTTGAILVFCGSGDQRRILCGTRAKALAGARKLGMVGCGFVSAENAESRLHAAIRELHQETNGIVRVPPDALTLVGEISIRTAYSTRLPNRLVNMNAYACDVRTETPEELLAVLKPNAEFDDFQLLDANCLSNLATASMWGFPMIELPLALEAIKASRDGRLRSVALAQITQGHCT